MRYKLACVHFTRLLFTSLFAVAVFVSSMGRLHAGYIFQDIIDPGDPTFNQALGINNAGTISGYFGSGAPGHPNQGYTVDPPYTSFNSENFPGSVQTQVVAINNTGVTGGFWSNTNLGVGMDANFGFVNDAFMNVNNPLTPAGGMPTNQILGVNDNNIAAGFYIDGMGNPQGFLYNIALNTFTPVTFMGATNTVATGVNNAGIVSGFYTNAMGQDVAFIDNGGTFTFFQAFGDSTMFFGINNTGYAVGTYVDGAGQNHGVLYNIATMSFQTVDDPFAAAGGGNGTTLNGLNDKNQLVGFYVNASGNTIGLLADPLPEPASLGLAGLGLALAAFRRRR